MDVMLGIEKSDNDHGFSWDRINTKAIILALNRFDWALLEGMNCKDLDVEEASGISTHRKNDL
ncbi:hypothetical protein FRX31_010851, partial [Thalictrum thalictroides]